MNPQRVQEYGWLLSRSVLYTHPRIHYQQYSVVLNMFQHMKRLPTLMVTDDIAMALAYLAEDAPRLRLVEPWIAESFEPRWAVIKESLKAEPAALKLDEERMRNGQVGLFKTGDV